jgi:hypothetical protein
MIGIEPARALFFFAFSRRSPQDLATLNLGRSERRKRKGRKRKKSG